MDATKVRISQLSSDGTVLDACYTLAGDKVATCSNTGTIQVWSCSNADQEWGLLHTEEIPDQPTQLAWAHPQHGLVLAIGTTTGTVHVLQGPAPSSTDRSNNNPQQQEDSASWRVTDKLFCGQGAVSALAFAPRQQGLVLAVGFHNRTNTAAQLGCIIGGSNVMVYEAAGIASAQLQWTLLSKIPLRPESGSCKCLCWREAAVGLPPLLLMGHSVGGSIWSYHQPNMQWKEVCMFTAPASVQQQAVQALHWAPALGRPEELVAVSYGTTVVIYRVLALGDSSTAAGGEADKLQLGADVACELPHPAPVWKLEFNMMGNTLACSLDGRPEIWFWMPKILEDTWTVVSKIEGGQHGVAEADTMLD